MFSVVYVNILIVFENPLILHPINEFDHAFILFNGVPVFGVPYMLIFSIFSQ